MSVDSTLALSKLYADVTADLLARAPAVRQYFGWREKNRQVLPATSPTNPTGARIDWQPGNDDGAAGQDLPPRNFGPRAVVAATSVPADTTQYHTRNLADLDELFVVRMRAHNPAQPTDESAQYILTRLLYNEWRAAMYRSAHGTVKIDSLAWNVDKNEFRSGAQLVATCRIRNPISDDLSVGVSPFQVALSAYLGDTTMAVIHIAPPTPPPSGD